MMKSFMVSLLMIVMLQTRGQNQKVYEVMEVTEAATFIGGQDSLRVYLERELHYPDAAMAAWMQGTFNVTFVIDPKGGISNVEIRNDSLGYGLEEEAIRVLLASSGMWKPAKRESSIVSVRYRMPLTFEINPKKSNSDSNKDVNAEVSPEFKYGNDSGLLRYIDSCMVYPDLALRVGAEGEVLVSWVVNTKGEISQLKTLGNRVGNGLDEEALRIIKTTKGLWRPGFSKEKPNSVRLSTVITFKLPKQGDSKETESLPKYLKIQADNILFENPISNAEYLGGQQRLLSFIAENFQIPESLILDDLDINQIIVMFEVDTSGFVEVIKTLGGSSGLGLEEEALRVIKLTSGNWKPATMDGAPIIQKLRIPIRICFN